METDSNEGEVEEGEIIDAQMEEENEIRRQVKEYCAGDTHSEDYLDFFKGEKESNADKIIKQYITLFDKMSINNEIFAHQTLHMILGQLYKHVKWRIGSEAKDVRFHLFFMQSSGSGKTSASPFIRAVCDGLKIPFFFQTGEITEASLVGSRIETKRIVKGRSRIEYEPVLGVLQKLQKNGILFWDEANAFLQSQEKEYNANIISYVTTAMNNMDTPGNKITKNMKGGDIEYQVSCSFGFTTYPIKNKLLDVLRTGFFQRVAPYCKILTREEWDSLSNKIIEDASKSQRLMTDLEWNNLLTSNKSSIDKLIDMLKKTHEFSKSIKRMYWNPDVDKKLKEIKDSLITRMSFLSGEIKETFQSFIVRTLLTIMIVSIHRAIMDFRRYVTKRDVEYASKLVITMLYSLIGTVESLEEVAKRDTIEMIRWGKLKQNWQFLAKKIKINSDGSIDTDLFIDMYSKYADISIPSVRRHLKVWEDKGLIRRKRTENTSKLYI